MTLKQFFTERYRLEIKKNAVITNTLKNAGLFQPRFVSNMDKPKCWV